MIVITPKLALDEADLRFTFIRSPGPGGQNVNKVATGVQLRFDVAHSPSLPDIVRTRLLLIAANQITTKGELVIKATRYRTQESNKCDAVERLKTLVKRAATIPKKRKKTKPTYASTLRRLDSKKLHSAAKSLRGAKPSRDDT